MSGWGYGVPLPPGSGNYTAEGIRDAANVPHFPDGPRQNLKPVEITQPDGVSLCARDVAPGILAYSDAGVAGWAAVAPRSELPFARSAKIPHVDDLPVWSAWCIRVRPGYRGQGISHVLLDGAVAYARSQGAPAIEGYPVDNQGKKVDLTMAFVGTRKLFEDAGFTKAADTSSVAGGFPRVLMRLDLR
jgi:GNAT superfamily N-acetyltransferase